MKYFSVEESPVFRKRLQVLPGLTTIATIYIPKDSSSYRKFRSGFRIRILGHDDLVRRPR